MGVKLTLAISGHEEKIMSSENGQSSAPLHRVVIPLQVWRIMTPQEYADQHERFSKHVAVSQEIVEDCQEVWVFLGRFVQFESG